MDLRRYKYEWKKLQDSVLSINNSFSENNYPSILTALLIVGEDHRYYSHNGVDLIAICRATWRTVFCKRREGGSTIAMQLVRVITGRYEKTLSRKAMEIYLAVKLTNMLQNDEIPELYLSVAYFGWRMNGLSQACERLKINITELSFKDAANLVARLKYPEPKICSIYRAEQIQIRRDYIISKYNKLYDSTIVAHHELKKSNGSI